MRNALKFVAVAVLLLLAACTKAPKVDTAPVQQMPATSSSENAPEAAPQTSALAEGVQAAEHAQGAAKADSATAVSQALLPLPAQTDTLEVHQAVLEDVPPAPVPEPYAELEKVAMASFTYVDSLIANDKADSALVELDKIVVLKPLWESWIRKAQEAKTQLKAMPQSQNRQMTEPIAKNAFSRDTTKRTDPYVEIQKIVAYAFWYADSAQSVGLADSALAMYEKIERLNPLWETWMANVAKLQDRSREVLQAHAAVYNSIAVQLVNENATRADYATVKALADSLVALEPGDSLKTFAGRQVRIAFEKNVKKATADKKKISEDAEKSGNFALADSLANLLLLRYRDFADTLKLEAWVESIHAQALVNSLDGDYWQKNSPKEALAKAEKLVANGKFTEAKELYVKLSTSSERDRARTALAELGKRVCSESRKKASDLYAKAMKSKKPADKTKNLESAVNALLTCVENFSDDAEAARAREDLKVLQQEK